MKTATTASLTIPRSLVALRDVCAGEKTRYALDYVHVRRVAGVAAVTTTDGKCLARASWDDSGADFETLISAEAFKCARSTSRVGLRLHVEAGRVTLDGVEVPPDEGKHFPPCDEIMPPASRAEARVVLDVGVLAYVGEALDAHAAALEACAPGSTLAVGGKVSRDCVVLCWDCHDALSSGVAVYGAARAKRKPGERERLHFPDLSVLCNVDGEGGLPKPLALNPRLLRGLADSLLRAAGVKGSGPSSVRLGIAGPEQVVRVTVPGESGRVRLEGLLMPISVWGLR